LIISTQVRLSRLFLHQLIKKNYANQANAKFTYIVKTMQITCRVNLRLFVLFAFPFSFDSLFRLFFALFFNNGIQNGDSGHIYDTLHRTFDIQNVNRLVQS